MEREMVSKNKKKSKKESTEVSAPLIETSKKVVAPVAKPSPTFPVQTKRLLPHNLLMEIDLLSERLSLVEKQLEELKSKI
jgi:hypothetical protein